MCTAHSNHVETHRRDVAEDADVGRWQQRILSVSAVKSCCHETDTKFRVGAVMRTADYTEVEFLVFFCLVGIVKVVEKAVYQVFLLRFALACRRVCSEVGC